MPRLPTEVLDSEDEDDLVVVPPTRRPSPPPASQRGEDAPPPDPSMDACVDQAAASSASTAELLRRAHKALMEPTQHVGRESSPAPPASSPGSRSKRRLTGAELEPRSSGKLRRIKPATDGPSSHAIELTVPGPTFPDHASTPVVATSDTIPGQTFPSLSTYVQNTDNETPKASTRRLSQQHASSADQNSSLTPWSVSAIDSSNHLNSDDAAIGLPKEMYKPRPSRSRSAQVEIGPVDYSKIPERVAKRVRRAKTDTNEAPDNDTIFPSHPILEAPEIERLSPSPVDLACERTQLGDTIAETPAEIFHQDLPPSSKPKGNAKKAARPKPTGKRGRPRKQPAVDAQDELASDEGIAAAEVATTGPALKAEVQILISPSRPKPSSNSVAMQADNPELLNNILAGLGHTHSAETTPQPDTEKPAKRGGRGSVKAATTKANEKPVNDAAVDEVDEPAPETEIQEESPAPARPTSVSEVEAPHVKTPQPTRKGPSKTSPPKPSWQRTPYRVGLSKSQRIPSLLKVFKK